MASFVCGGVMSAKTGFPSRSGLSGDSLVSEANWKPIDPRQDANLNEVECACRKLAEHVASAQERAWIFLS